MLLAPNYKEIADYGIIGNLLTVALVGRDGAIDWCCFPELPNASVFGALLDYQKGGRFSIRPERHQMGEQRYFEKTNVLETCFDTMEGRLRLVDFMPLGGDLEGKLTEMPLAEIHRLVECESGTAEIGLEWSPRFDYARGKVRIEEAANGYVATGQNGERLTLGGVPSGAQIVDSGFGPTLVGTFKLSAGERLTMVCRWDTEETECNVMHTLELLKETERVWRLWVDKEETYGSRTWAQPYSDIVIRSELALKLLTNGKSGAFAAAGTTSLPERIGGERNWDYRYSWIRDAALTSQALLAMGHRAEARDFLQWAEVVSSLTCLGCEGQRSLRLLYGLHGETELEEYFLEHLEGYMRSTPVRIGNLAAEQQQHDIYGEILGAAYELLRMGEEVPPDIWELIIHAANEACARWREPDHGIWEVRGGKRHFTYSKVMVWVALDRAIYLADVYGMNGNVAQWRKSCREVREFVLKECFDQENMTFIMAPNIRAPDAANLLLPVMELLPFDDPRVQGTIDYTLKHLMDNKLLYRYHADDGLPTGEGTFGLCTFWMVNALALSGRMDEAWEIFDNMVGKANHLGLFAEQVDAETGILLGNFPQAFTHIGLINSRIYLAHGDGKDVPMQASIGTKAHRRIFGRKH